MDRATNSRNTRHQDNDNGHSTLVEIKPPKKRTAMPDKIEVFSIERQRVALTICGDESCGLIVNNFHQKGIDEIEDNRRLSQEDKVAAKRAPRPPVIPAEKYMNARVLDEKGRDCVAARWLKAGLVTAIGRYKEIGLFGTQASGAFYVLGDLLPIKFTPDGTGKKTICWDGSEVDLAPYLRGKNSPKVHPFMRRDVVRVGKPPNKQPDLRYRPEYRNWSLDIVIEYEPALISLQALHHIIRRAGMSVGLCEWRPGKSAAGCFGRFDLEAAKVQVRS